MILVTRFSALGDIAMTVPALYDACAANPDEQFLMLTRKGPARLFINTPGNLRVVGIDLDEFKGAAGLWRLAGKLAEAGVTRMVDLHDVIRTQALRTFLAAKGVRSVRLHKGRVAKKNLTRATRKHIVPLKNSIERYRDAFVRAGLKMEPRFRSLFPDGADPALFAAATPPRKETETWIGLAPFARHKGKIYPPDLMEKCIAELCSRPEVKLFLFAGGPDEEAKAAEWAGKFPAIVNLAPLHMGFEAEMALMNHCDVVVSMDSANMHLASLAGTRVVSVWGATHPFCGFMGFNQVPEDTIQLEMSCRPCSVFGNKPCRRGDYHCLRGIAPGRIAKAALGALALLISFSAFPFPMKGAEPGVFNPVFPDHNGFPPVVSRSAPDPEAADYDAYLARCAQSLLEAGNVQQALAIYREVIPTRLPLSDRTDFWYGYASAGARLGLLEIATRAAEVLKNEENGADAANFIAGYIAYRENDFKKARKLLGTVPARFLPKAYLAQMELSDGNWKKADALARETLQFLDNDRGELNSEIADEMTRTVGLANFKLKNFADARGLLTRYVASSPSPAADAIYALGQIEFESGNLDEAARLLAIVADDDNVLAQGASYTLAQMDAASGSDREAALAFSRAARMNFDPLIGQNAIYNYIAAGSKGGAVPFASATEMYESYLANGRGTDHDDQLALRFAREYFNEGNYSKALECVERIQFPDAESLGESLKILYRLARQEVAAGKFAEAESHLLTALSLPGKQDPKLLAECRLWLAEAQYGTGKFAKAADSYALAAKSLTGPNRTLALYDYAYALFQQDKFALAAKAFADALAAKPALPEAQSADAALRLADCRFYSGNYAEALKGYEAAAKKESNPDYAAMRRAVALGLTGDVKGKIAALEAFGNLYPSSRWMPDVLLELGNTYASLDLPDKAASAFARIKDSHPSSPQARRGNLAMAQALAKKGDLDGAAEAYMNVIRSWPSSEEASLANQDMLAIAARRDRLQEYADFLLSVPGAPKLDSDRIEELAFNEAESKWADNLSDISALVNYLNRYPDGRFVSDALYCLATSDYESGNRKSALDRYLRLVDIGETEFVPAAYVGVMRSTDNPSQRAAFAAKVLANGGVDAEAMQEAQLFNAIGLLDNKNRRAEGVATLTALAKQTDLISGARAAVELGEWQLKAGNTADALKTLTAFTDAGSPHAYWLARGFIALSDAYRSSGNALLADEYLRSLKANYPGREPDILNAISSRLK